MNSIIGGLDKGSMLIKGGAQYHKDDIAINLTKQQKVGVGVYCSPHFQIALGYADSIPIRLAKHQYHLVLQCRVDPKKVKVCELDQTYWVLNEPKDIRPYGILLIKRHDA